MRGARAAAILGLSAPLLVGLAVVLVAAGYSGVGAVFEEKYEVTVVFDDVSGLIPGADVKAGGLQIGKVESVAFDHAGYPKLILALEHDFRLRGGARAAVVTTGPAAANGAHVELAQGDGPELREGAVIGRKSTWSPEPLDKVLSALTPRTRADLRSFFAHFDKATAGRGPDIEESLRHSADALGETADLAAQLNSDGQALRTLVSRARVVVGAIEQDPGSLGAFADRLSELFATTAAYQTELDLVVQHTVEGLSAGRRGLARFSASVPNLRRFVADARPGVRELRATAPALRATFARARPAFRELSALIRTAPGDLARIRPLLRTAPAAFREGAPALRDSVPIFNEARVRFPEALAFFGRWGDFTANYDANGGLARFGVFLAGTPRNPIGPSDTGPGRVRKPFIRDPGTLDGDPWPDFRDSFVRPAE